MADNRTLNDFVQPQFGSTSSIARSTVEPNNFEIKTSLIMFIMQDQFSGTPMENPSKHLNSFIEKYDTLKINGVDNNAIRLKLFPFSLKENAKEWLQGNDPDFFKTWDSLSRSFLTKFFPPGKTAKLRGSINSFSQYDQESLYEAWERFKALQRQCPHHGIQDWMLIQIFYNGLKPDIRFSIDTAAGGTIMSKTPSAIKELIEKLALNHYQWPGDRIIHKKAPSENDAMAAIVAKIDDMSANFENKLALISKPQQQTQALQPPLVCDDCGIQGHDPDSCPSIGSFTMEQMNAFQSQP